MPTTPRSKHSLIAGAVRPWHVLFILLVAYVTGLIAAYKVTIGLDPGVRAGVSPMLNDAIVGVILLVFTLVVPEFRRVLPALFKGPDATPKAGDTAWALFAMVCWAYGLYRVAFVFPLVRERPDLYDAFGFSEVFSDYTWRYAALAFTSIVFAPIAEELMFRGFLMNLWIARWGIWIGVLASSLVFGLFHLERTVFATVLGFAFALTYLRYDSLWPGIVLHATYNLLCFNRGVDALIYLKPRASVGDPANWSVEFVLAILFFPAAWQFWRRFRPRHS